jgi:exportin-2 (importin alpha re-exporter)
MRLILGAKLHMAAYGASVIPKLAEILTAVSKNPSQPNFNHFLFESISAQTRSAVNGSKRSRHAVLCSFGCQANPDAAVAYEEILFPIFGVILQQDIIGLQITPES